MKIISILLIIMLTSCSVIEEGIHGHYILYHKTKAFFVVEEMSKYKRLLVNAQGTQHFIFIDYYQEFCQGDTILVTDYPGIQKELTFTNARK